MAARDQVMSSTERAPEPTMEEILASIRRIISDDEANAVRQQRPATQSRPVDEGLDGGEGEPDDEIINDIARVLSKSGGAPQEAAAEAAEAPEETAQEDEILDLTAELGGLELVEEETEELELVEVVEEEAPIELFNPAPARPAQVAAPAEPEFESEPEPELELVEEVVEEEPVAEAGAFEAEPAAAEAPPAEASPPRQMSASEEAASALERAIAALRAGQVPMSPSFSFEPQPEPVFTSPPAFQPMPEPAPAMEASPSTGFAPSYEPVSIPEPVPSPEPFVAESTAESEPAVEAEAELVLTEVEAEGSEAEGSEPDLAVEAAPSEPQSDQAWGLDSPPSWSAKPEAETPVTHVNGGSQAPYATGTPKSLEDSVKDMLRPMLQKWLDENMTRVLTAALKDELKDNPARLRGE